MALNESISFFTPFSSFLVFFFIPFQVKFNSVTLTSSHLHLSLTQIAWIDHLHLHKHLQLHPMRSFSQLNSDVDHKRREREGEKGKESTGNDVEMIIDSLERIVMICPMKIFSIWMSNRSRVSLSSQSTRHEIMIIWPVCVWEMVMMMMRGEKRARKKCEMCVKTFSHVFHTAFFLLASAFFYRWFLVSMFILRIKCDMKATTRSARWKGEGRTSLRQGKGSLHNIRFDGM